MSRVCAHCGELFDDERLACPHCGADADLTWSEAPEPAFGEDPDGYEDLIEHEFGASMDARWVPILIGIVVFALLIWLLVG